MAEKAEGNLLPMIDQYHEAAVTMICQGTIVNHIAKTELPEKAGGLHQRRKYRNQNKEKVYPVHRTFSKIR